MAKLTDWLLFSLIPGLVLLHLYVSPYTKVEESFNIQAIHDILTYGIPTKDIPNTLRAEYDHVSFPGAVPRTFVGALVVAGVARPVIWLNSQIDRQMLVRGVLGAFNALTLISYAKGVRRAFGKDVAVWYILFQASQFHVIYYASRTLPNMFAFGITTLALRNLLPESTSTVQHSRSHKRHRLSLYLITVSGIIFRSEIALLLATTTLYLWAKKRITLFSDILPAALSGLTVGLLLTITTDSILWQSFPLWPELSAFKYNVLSGQASAWGTSPWHFYFTNALPRLLLNPLTYTLFIPFSILQPSTRHTSISLLFPPLTYILLYSLQPHKEWRFILYSIPPLTAAASLGAAYVWTHRTKSPFYQLLSLALCLSTLATFAISTFLLLPISAANYPGAHALNALHKHHLNENNNGASSTLLNKEHIRVHMDNLSCQTGITLFLQKPAPKSPLIVLPGSPDGKYPEIRSGTQAWVYDKTEARDIDAMKDPKAFWDRFDYVLVEVGADGTSDRPGRWEAVQEIKGFGGVKVLGPGDEGGEEVEEAVSRRLFGDAGLKGWRWAKGVVRRYISRGWWVEVQMVPKIRVLRRLR
ncbi:dolichyl-P-Man:Man(7)GlcNAc(2)-PP-dolichol alpha-1,6-mannosyltransferase [Paracoccidioides brasiliensis Pb18]|uniref:Mannosyltransferase n=1 Tax=Paracoccidioides brasiliensis (strain Pb18) TaxID=502780 RepID=C1G3P5_PARBD|nr:dolichyl-P-Man:Man(7)GlcNAc(2)-PP-dolichol alpha-1,6-mannosyltransferase [Paracoccidioides brasiliensis Pb18]EEH45411.2 hypothetical protein PADG_01561 [Paracoccidioides brasiliensis Pb18]